jgi:hypothetical protein
VWQDVEIFSVTAGGSVLKRIKYKHGVEGIRIKFEI